MANRRRSTTKIIGTAVSISALRSRQRFSSKNGAFADGLIFLDWLKKTGQTAWQVLPLSQTHLAPGSVARRAASPYRGYGVGLDPRYLTEEEKVRPVSTEEKKAFSAENRAWLLDYALFCALRDRFGTDDWTKWPQPIRSRQAKALRQWRRELAADIDRQVTEQCRLHRSFFALKKRSRELGIAIIGDMPFYLPLPSPLVWAHQKCFALRADGRLEKVSGMPNTAKSHFGRQIWGHPLYNWPDRCEWPAIIRLWKLRLKYLGGLHDTLRLDHVKGFFDYGVMTLADPRADGFLKGPGLYVLSRLVGYARKQGLEIFAEDAGDRLRDARAGLSMLGIPGIKLLRFAYNEKNGSFDGIYADLKFYPTASYAYTTTHDTEPLLGYVRLLKTAVRQEFSRLIGAKYSADEKVLAARWRDVLLRSPSQTVIIPIQDWLLLSDRVNLPGTEKMINDRNWRFRLPLAIENLPVSPIKQSVSAAS